MGSKTSNTADFLQKTREVWQRAMLQGWAAGVEGDVVAGSPELRRITFEEGDYRVVHEYSSTPDPKGRFAITECVTIWHLNTKLWEMFSHGVYDESVMGFLRASLLEGYAQDHTEAYFYGGRGPGHRREDPFTYVSMAETIGNGGNFSGFRGEELIHAVEGSETLLGKGEYQGGLCVSLEVLPL